MHFLKLPREIRDIIYNKVLETDRPTPELDGRDDTNIKTLAVEGGEDRHKDEPRPSLERLNGGRFSPPINCLSLMLCNRQILAEINQRLEATKNLTAVVVVALGDSAVQTREMIQWYSVPAPFRYIKTVECHVRLMTDTWTTDEWELRRGWMGDGGPGRSAQWLLQTLSKFLQHGPGFEHDRKYPGTLPPLESLVVVFAWPKGLKYKRSHKQRIRGSERIPFEEDVQRLPYELIHTWVRILAYSGVIHGFVKSCTVTMPERGESLTFEALANGRDLEKLMHEWAPYGWVLGKRGACCKLPIFGFRNLDKKS